MSPPLKISSLIPSSTITAVFPPKCSKSPPVPNPNQPSPQPLPNRREAVAALILSLIPLRQPPPASAFNFGISGPKDWLREQKKKSSKFLLAPIDASRNSLQAAYLLIKNADSDYAAKDMEEVRRLLNSAARDCVPGERNSFVNFQANTGVEVCTFRLVLKNAASLLDDKDPTLLEAEAKLSDLVRSFSSLNDMVNENSVQISNRQKVADALMDTIASLNKFEQGVKDCLEI